MSLIQRKGVENEKIASEYYERKGYRVFNVNKDFPDLVLIKGGKVEGFVEVKAVKHPVHPAQERTLEELRKLGFQIAVVRIVRGKVIVESEQR